MLFWTTLPLGPPSAWSARAICPCRLPTTLASLWSLAGNVDALMRFARRQGFKRLTVPLLTLLFSDCKAPYQNEGAKPSNEAGLIEGLAKHILGDAADVAEVMKARASTPDELATVLTSDLLEGAADLIDEGDLADIKAKVLAADTAREENTLRQRGPVRGGISGAASSSDGAARARMPMPPLPDGTLAYTLAEMREMAPVLKGLSLTREEKWHHRWKCTYPCGALSKTTSRVFATPESETHAQLHVLRFLWEVHARETGAARPIDFL